MLRNNISRKKYLCIYLDTLNRFLSIIFLYYHVTSSIWKMLLLFNIGLLFQFFFVKITCKLLQRCSLWIKHEKLWTFPLALFWVYHKIFNWKIILSVSAKVLGKQKANHATWSVILYFNIFILNSKYPYRYWWVCAFIYINYKCLCQTFPYNTIHRHLYYDSFECLEKLK